MKYRYLILLPLVIGMIGCTPRPRAVFYPGTPHFPPTDPASVRLLRNEPRAFHIKLGEVRFTPAPDMPSYYVEGVLKEKASMMGADALVIVVDNYYREAVVHGHYWPHVNVYRERVIVGVAIKYRPL